MTPAFQNYADNSMDDAALTPQAEPDTEQSGQAMCAIALGVIAGAVVIVALHWAGVLL